MGAGRCVSVERVLYRQAKEGAATMAIKANAEDIKVWFDREADLLEVTFEDKVGYFKDTADDRVMVRVDLEDRIIGFQIMFLSTFEKPEELCIAPVEAEVESP